MVDEFFAKFVNLFRGMGEEWGCKMYIIEWDQLIMELYHGSNIEIAVPEIRESSRRLDFGTGFYTTSSFDQAKRWSLNKAKLEKSSDAVVSVYSVPDDLLCVETLKIFNFEKADE